MNSPSSIPPRLTAKQRRFIAEYRVDFNAAGAARRAGYSSKTAKQQGYRLLTNVYLAAMVADCRSLTNVDIGTGPDNRKSSEVVADSDLRHIISAWSRISKHDRQSIRFIVDLALTETC